MVSHQALPALDGEIYLYAVRGCFLKYNQWTFFTPVKDFQHVRHVDEKKLKPARGEGGESGVGIILVDKRDSAKIYLCIFYPFIFLFHRCSFAVPVTLRDINIRRTGGRYVVFAE